MTQDYTYSTHAFAGIQIDSFITEDGRHWATLTPLAQACGGSRQNMVDWVARKGNLETLDVKVGKFKKAAKAYLISDIGDYLDYRVELGDKKALALYSATFRADLERSIKEAHGIQVTAAQHEETRVTIREALLKKVLSQYSGKVGSYLEKAEMVQAGLTDVEQKIAGELAYIKVKETCIERDRKNPAATAQWQKAIQESRQRILVIKQSV